MIPSALAWDCALRMKVNVMLRACGLPPPQAPTRTAATSTVKTLGAVRIMLRITMAIACPADAVGGKGLRGLGHTNDVI
ncbi:hypothetical protein Mkiyose1665_54730 [Mycobacterium kiyosense]|uniref:Uncharacterized protein n=1 Tax=Mycobacterium kiyosense TaxID=2871094 RepID=A0AA37V0G4_9MYCO|nr:hypothetical protein IWGMT90018_11760 [Mycobacterium kiyosense]GLB85848.1 hypothetical protein SRL2020028_51040 [Mycobacterium kiyosense]GLB96978.1 hypothetical protein SRL2020226_37540 [Mycobacterium kiyosense]GLC04878.1 hypothetical protein SRL2020400_54690 [Mycobacterium kiyosense]GLC10745.1 hypothetical protein SRL2020411_53910 [Mycobacterium kiyosense]